MSARRVAILGASGFVGTTLAERLHRCSGFDVVPVIHTAASAWRLARLGIPLVQLDIANVSALRDVLRTATYVVNCTRGPREVMIDGLANILLACRAARVSRFVHLSSVMVYGDPPPAESEREDAEATPLPGADSYGMIKLEQDKLVQAAAAAGLPSVVLCPPNVSGPFSGYVVGIVDALRKGSFALAGDGNGACNLVDVRNLCHAIELALQAEAAPLDGSRMFVTDGEQVCWRNVVAELLDLSGAREVRRIERTELQRLTGRGTTGKRPTIRRSLRHLMSSEVRSALRKDPLLAKLDIAARTAVTKLGRGMETKIRLGIEGPMLISRPDPYATLAVGLCSQQLREVRHLSDRAKQRIGYSASVTFGQSMADFRAWYRAMHGTDTPFWSMSKNLYG